MLSRHERHDPRHDAGSTLITVIVVMLVLSVFAIALAGAVTSTVTARVTSRASVDSRAAADAGLAAVVAHARRTGDFCGLTVGEVAPPPNSPVYEVWSTDCPGSEGEVTFTVTGNPDGPAPTTIQAKYAYAPVPSGAAELVFFNTGSDSVYFTNHVLPESAEGLATILFPGGGLLECKTTIPGTIITTGSFQGQSGCLVKGGLFAGGDNPAPGGWAVYLNNDDQVLGGVTAIGNVSIGGGTSKVGQTLLLPTTARLQVSWADLTASKPTANARVKGGAAGGIQWSATLAEPVLPEWFEYKHNDSKWVGFKPVKIDSASSPYNCSNINTYDTTFWSAFVTNLSEKTVIDLTACADGIQTGSIKDDRDQASLGVDVAFIAQKFRFSDFELTPKSGKDPNAWFVVPDPTDDGKPTCSGSRTIETDANINIRVRSMAYTPCEIRVGYGGVWTGAMYAGTLNDGGDIKIYTHPMGLPGQWAPEGGGGGGGGGVSLGGLVSRRDVP